jgi:hypothetical protein
MYLFLLLFVFLNFRIGKDRQGGGIQCFVNKIILSTKITSLSYLYNKCFLYIILSLFFNYLIVFFIIL